MEGGGLQVLGELHQDEPVAVVTLAHDYSQVAPETKIRIKLGVQSKLWKSP